MSPNHDPAAQKNKNALNKLARKSMLRRTALRKELRASGNRYQHLIHAINGILWEADASTLRFSFVSRQAERILGYPLECWINEPTFWRDHIHPADQEWVVAYCLACTGEMIPHEFEYRMIAADGRTVWLHDSITVMSQSDQPRTLHGLMVDITERKRAEQHLHLSNKAIESATEGSIITDATQPDHPIIFANQTFYALTGYTPAEVIGRNCRFLQGHDTDQQTIAEIKQCIALKKTFEGDILNYKKDGTPFWNFLRISPILDDHGQCTHFAGFQTDITKRKQIEQQLHDLNERFDKVFRSSPAGILIFRRSDGRALDTNDTYLKMIGYARAEVLGHTAAELNLFIDQDSQALQPSANEHSIFGTGTAFRTKSGEIRYAICSLETFEMDGEALEMLVTIDITERKQAEEALRTLHERFELIGEAANDAMWEWDLETNVVWSNLTHQELFGLTLSDPVPDDQEWKRRLHPDEREQIYQSLQAARASTSTVWYGEYRLRTDHKGWMSIYARTYIERNADGKAVRMIGSMIDITARKQAEDAIRFQATLLNAVGQAVIATDTNGIITYLNSAAESMYGWTANEALGRNIVTVTVPQASQEQAAELLNQLTQGKSWEGEFPVQRRDGSIFPSLVHDSPVLDDTGKLIGIIGVSSDITERKQAEEALQQAQEERKILLDTIEGIVWEADANTFIFSYVNQQAERLLGYPIERWTSEPTFWKDYIHPDDQGWAVDYRAAQTQAQTAHDFEYRMIAADGRIVWLRDLVAVISENNRPVKLRGIMVDITERKQMEIEIQNQRYFFNQITNTMGQGLTVTRNGIFEYVNPAFANMLGCSQEDIVGKTPEDITSDLNLPTLKNELSARLNGLTSSYESRLLHVDGRGIDVFVTASPLHEGGRIVGSIAVITDNTARKQAEETLKEIKERYEMALIAGNQGAWLVDWQKKSNIVDERWAAMLGYTLDEVGQSLDFWESKVHPDDLKKLYSVFERHERGEIPMIEVEVRARTKSGEWKWISDRAQILKRTPDGAPWIMAGIHSDITARKQMEEALAHREAQFAGIIDSAMDAIITVDAEQRIVLFNRAAEQVFGCVAAAVFGQTLDRFIPPELHAAHRQHIPAFGHTAVTRRSMYAPGVLEALRADGTRFPIEASISQITVGGATFYTVILRDISQHRALEAQLQHAQKMESVGRLAGGVAHDFNNLLMVIGGVTDLIREALPADHPVQTDLIDVSTAAERAAALTRQLLAFARRQILAPRVLDINTLVQETAPLLHRLLGEDIAVLLDLLPSPLPVRADPNQLQQVLINLAVNARDAMPAGGLLRISTRLTTRSDLVQGADTTSSAAVRIIVQDTGVGIPPEVLSRIFEPFFTTKAVGHGTGLGLATSYGIITQHGGQIAVQSQVGEGTAFTVALPIVDAIPEAVASPPPIGVLPGGSETILVVEDEGAVRAFVERVLRALGYTVLFAQDGLDALQLAQRGLTFDLLLTDMVLPGLHGSTLAARLTARQPHLRVIYMSGYAEHATLPEELLAQGVLLQKPFTAGTLARLVRTVLEQAPDA